DGDHDALRTVVIGGRAHQLGVGDRGAVDADFVGAGIEQALHVGDLAYAATDGQRDEHLRGDLLDDGQNQVATVAGGGDVQERELVGALLVVSTGDFNGIAGIGQIDEID